MLIGDFKGAWRESDFITASGAHDQSRLWDGRPLRGRRVILRCLHGYGDAIQFIRYAPKIRREAASLSVETHPEMVSTLRRAEGVDDVISWGRAAPVTEPRWDRQIEIMELPLAFRTTIGTIPRRVPYLTAEPARIQRACRLIGDARSPKIGVVWASSGYNPSRTVPFREFLPIISEPGFSWYSLQHGPEREDLRAADSSIGIHDMAAHSPEIADTAAFMATFDLIITTDGVAAHLAGALARPVWTLLPYEADWRWMTDRDDSPWYPTMRLFRQQARGRWTPTINKLIERLRRLRHSYEYSASE